MSLRSDFMWGFATAAAQIEGGGEEQEKASGRGDSVCLSRKPRSDAFRFGTRSASSLVQFWMVPRSIKHVISTAVGRRTLRVGLVMRRC